MMRISYVMSLLGALCLLSFTDTQAQPPVGMMGRSRMMGPPAFFEHVFPPELVMRYQSEINLTPAQQEAITRDIAETQTKLIELQWRSEAATQAFTKILEKNAVDEAAALAQWDQLSAMEQQIKKAHLGLLIRIKNQLTPSQQDKLRALRPARPGPPFHRGPEDLVETTHKSVPRKARFVEAEARGAGWIPAFAEMVMRWRRALDNETFVGAKHASLLLLGGMTSCPRRACSRPSARLG